MQQVGFDVVVDTISDMVSRAKKDAGVDPNTPLITLVSRSQIITHSLPKLYTKINVALMCKLCPLKGYSDSYIYDMKNLRTSD